MILCGTVSNGKRCPEMVSRVKSSQSVRPTLMANVNCPAASCCLIAARRSAALGKTVPILRDRDIGHFQVLLQRASKSGAQHGSSTAEEREGDGSRLLAATQDTQHPTLTGASITSVGKAADQEKTCCVSFIHSSHTTAKPMEQLVTIKQ